MPGFARRAYGQNMPLADVFPFPLFKNRAPGSKDKNYLIGQVWVYKVSASARSVYIFGGLNASGVPIWSQAASGTGDLSTLTGTSGGAIAPIASNINLAAGTGMLSIVGTAGTLTFNVNFASPPAIGSGTPNAITGTTVASTGAMTAGTGLTATTGNIAASSGNVSASAAVSAGTTVTAGTGITATTGNIAASSGNVSASAAVSAGTTVTAGTGITATTGNIVASAGAINAGTSMTATLGNITATNGNLVLNTAGNGIQVKAGSNARIGLGAVLSGGTLAVANTSVTANTMVIPVVTTLGTVTAAQALHVTKNAGVGFTVTSADATDTSTFDWYLVESI